MSHGYQRHVTWFCHAQNRSVMSRMNEPCHIWKRHVTYERVMSSVHQSCGVWSSRVTYGWIMSHMDESCHIRTNHVTCAWVMSRMSDSCHVWTSHCTYKRLPTLRQAQNSRTLLLQDTPWRATPIFPAPHTPPTCIRAYVWHDSFICVTQDTLPRARAKNSSPSRKESTRIDIRVCEMTHAYMSQTKHHGARPQSI